MTQENNDMLYIEENNISEIIELIKLSKTEIKISPSGKSMYPFFNNIDFIVVKPIEFKNVAIGDVILFTIKLKNLAAHRVIKIIDAGSKLITKGDSAYKIDENPVDQENFIGKIVKVEGKYSIFSNWGLNKYIGNMFVLLTPVALRLVKVYRKLSKK